MYEYGKGVPEDVAQTADLLLPGLRDGRRLGLRRVDPDHRELSARAPETRRERLRFGKEIYRNPLFSDT
jgi:hypothetical protein